MAFYDVNFNILINRVSPPNKRGAVHLAWLRCLVAPLNTLNVAFFTTYFNDVKARAKRTGQKIILEDTLNTVFNSSGIRIDNTGDNLGIDYFYREDEGYEAIYFYDEAEGEEPNYFYSPEEYIGAREFVVLVPTAVLSNFSEAQIKAEVNKYRPAGTTYKILTY